MSLFLKQLADVSTKEVYSNEIAKYTLEKMLL